MPGARPMLFVAALFCFLTVVLLIDPQGDQAPDGEGAGGVAADASSVADHAGGQSDGVAEPVASSSQLLAIPHSRGIPADQVLALLGLPPATPPVDLPATLSGRVVDEAGQACRDLEVCVTEVERLLDANCEPADRHRMVRGSLQQFVAITDAGGRFSLTGLPPRVALVVVIDPGGPRMTLSPAAELGSVGWTRLAPGAVSELGDVVARRGTELLRGQVVTADGAAVGGALIAIDAVRPGRSLDGEAIMAVARARVEDEFEAAPDLTRGHCWADVLVGARTHCDASGYFRLEGPRRISASVRLLAAHPHLLPALSPPIEVYPFEERDLGAIELESGGRLAVRLVDAADQPVVKAEVYAGHLGEAWVGTTTPIDQSLLAWLHFIGTTGVDGWIERGGVPAELHTLALVVEGMAMPIVVGQVRPGEPRIVVVPPRFSLFLNLRAAGDRPIEDPRIQVTPQRRRRPAPLCVAPRELAPGRFEVPGLAAGRYDIDVAVRGFMPTTISTEVALGAAEVTVDLQPAAPAEVLVVDADSGRGIAGASVSLGPDAPDDGWRFDRRIVLVHPPVRTTTAIDKQVTDERGAATFRDELPDRYWLYVTHAGYAPLIVHQNRWRNRTPGTLKLARLGDLAGHLVFTGSVPAVRPLIAVLDADRRVLATDEVDAQGRFRLVGLPPDRLTLAVIVGEEAPVVAAEQVVWIESGERVDVEIEVPDAPATGVAEDR